MSRTQYRDARSQASSPPTSSSSRDDMLIDAFFAPEYAPTDIKSWRSGLKPEVPVYYPGADAAPLQHGFLFDAATLYHPHGAMNDAIAMPPNPHPIAARVAKRGSQDSTASGSSAMSAVGELTTERPPSKRTRKEALPNTRVSGACTRCKRLKMKCTFADNDTICARCIVGSHECVVLGRKPRSPGMREILRKQIREKDAQIDRLLAQLNPAAHSTTPLVLNVARLALTPDERAAHRDVLAYFDKAQGARGGERGKIDVSTLDDESEYEDDEEDDDDKGAGADADGEEAIHQLRLPTCCAPAGLVATAALETRAHSQSRMSSPSTSVHSDGAEDAEAGIGSLSYFEPGPSANLDLRRLIIERQAAPEILLSGLVANEDVGPLFQIFWKWINPLMPILDENIHTPASVLGRCPFLFTVVCTLASRFYDAKPHMYALAIHVTKAAAASAFLDGWKTLEMCQAYALMAAYMPPARRWDEDRTWFYSGVAFRLAIDLDLGRPPAVRPAGDERAEREVLNRLRTYVICYIVDRSFGINLGKPFMVPEVELIRNVRTQFLGSKYPHRGDAYMASLVELYRIMTRFADVASPAAEAHSGTLSDLDLVATHKVFAEELAAWEVAAAERCAADEASTDAEDRLRMGLLHSVYQYCRLVTFSAGLHQVLRRGTLQEDTVFFAGCLHAGSAVINCVVERILPTGFLRFSPEHVFALSAFATAVLMKCLRPAFASKLAPAQETRILALVTRLLRVLDADADDAQATPRRCYARFLQQLLESRAGSSKRAGAAAEGAREVMETTAVKQEQPVAGQTAMDEHGKEAYADADADAKLPGLGPLLSHTHTHAHDVSFLNAWDSVAASLPHDQTLDAANGAADVNPLLSFNESEYMQTFMAFPDQTWFMQ